MYQHQRNLGLPWKAEPLEEIDGYEIINDRIVSLSRIKQKSSKLKPVKTKPVKLELVKPPKKSYSDTYAQKLDSVKVLAIKNLLETTHQNNTIIAHQFDVTPQAISKILKGLVWVHVTGGAIARPTLRHHRSPDLHIQAEIIKLLDEGKLTYAKITEEIKNNFGVEISIQICYDLYRKLKREQGLTDYRKSSVNDDKTLDRESVLEIIKLLKDTDIYQNEIAKQFGVTPNAIAKIKNGRSWKSLTEPHLVNGKIPRASSKSSS